MTNAEINAHPAQPRAAAACKRSDLAKKERRRVTRWLQSHGARSRGLRHRTRTAALHSEVRSLCKPPPVRLTGGGRYSALVIAGSFL